MSLQSNNLESVVELYTENYFPQLVMAAQTVPAFLGSLCELVDHGESGLVGKTGLHPVWMTPA